MNVLNKLAYLEETKELIKNAIISKGVPVHIDDTFRSYVDKIMQIQGNTGIVLPEKSWKTDFDNIANSYTPLDIPSYSVTNWIPSPHWYDIETILQNDSEEYPAKLIVLLDGNLPNINLQYANFYRTSDGVTYTDETGGTTINHVWDTTLDTYNEGLCTRYVIYYFSDPYVQSRGTFIPANALYAISDGVSWVHSNTSSSSSSISANALVYNKPYLECIKIKNCTFERSTSLYRWLSNNTRLKRVDIDFGGLSSITNVTEMFYSSNNLQEVYFSNLGNHTKFDYMFQYNSGLRYITIDLTDLDVTTTPTTRYMFRYSNLVGAVLKLNPNVDKYVNTTNMFADCGSLQWVYVQGTNSYTSFNNLCSVWDAQNIYIENSDNVTDFSRTFNNCRRLVNVHIPNFTNVTNCQYMFEGCSQLKTCPPLKIPATLSGDQMDYMFAGCTSLSDITRLDISEATSIHGLFRQSGITQANINCPNCVSFGAAFYDCANLLKVTISCNTLHDLRNCFESCEVLETVKIITTTPYNTHMDRAFYTCTNLDSVDMDTSLVDSMIYTFYHCTGLVDIPNLDYSKVVNFSHTFESCSGLKMVDLTQAVSAQNYNYTFSGCTSLVHAILYNDGTITNLDQTFTGCTALREAQIGHTGGCTTLFKCFYDCRKLISVPELDLTSCTTLERTFYNCHWIHTVSLKNMFQITTMANTFENCYNLQLVRLPACDKLSTLENTFYNCSSLENVTLTALPVLTTMKNTFYSCTSLKQIELPDLPSVTSLESCFMYCNKLESIVFNQIPNVTNLKSTFESCGSLKSISNLQPTKVITLQNTFRYCGNLTIIPITVLPTTVTNMSRTFESCKSVIDWNFLSGWDTTNVSNMSYLFNNCSFSSINLNNWIFDDTIMEYFLANNPNLTSVELDFKNRTNNQSHAYMFANCSNLTQINLINTTNFSNFMYMFAQCTGLTEYTMNLADFGSSNKRCGHMFMNCTNLQRIVLDFANRSFDTYSDDYCGYMFEGCINAEYITLINLNNAAALRYMLSNFKSNKDKVELDFTNSVHNITECVGLFRNSCNNIKIRNFNTAPSNPVYNISNGYICKSGQDYIARPDQKDAIVVWKLPYKIQVNYLKFTSRYTGDSLGLANKCRFWADVARTIPLTDELSVEEQSFATAEFQVSDIVTDTIVVEAHTASDNCFIGIDNIFIGAKAKAVIEWENWTRPNLTSNSSYGRTSSSSEVDSRNDWRALDGSTSGNYAGWSANNQTTGWWMWKLPHLIKITSLTHLNNYDSDQSNVEGRFYTDSTKRIPIGETISTPTTSWARTEITGIPSEGIITDTIYFEKTGGYNYGGIGELLITAQKANAVYYDWNTTQGDVDVGQNVWVDWNQPVITANDSYGLITASSMFGDGEGEYIEPGKVEPFKAVDGDGTTQWISMHVEGGSSLPQWWMWKLPTPIRISKLEFYNRANVFTKKAQFFADEAMTIPLGSEFIANESSETPTEISVDNIVTDTIKLNITECYRTDFTAVGMSELKITAQVEQLIIKRLVTTDWCQPILTSHTSFGTISAQSELPARRLSGQNMFSDNKLRSNGINDRVLRLPDTGSVYYMRSFFANDNYTECIDNLDFSSVTGQTRYDRDSIFYNTRITGATNIKNIRVSLDISACSWNRQALLNFIGALIPLNRTSAQTLTIGATNLSKLTDEEKILATSKNWNLN